MLGGGEPDSRHPITPYYRDYVLAKEFGFSKEVIDESPAVWLDWLLAIHGEVKEAEVKAQQKAHRV